MAVKYTQAEKEAAFVRQSALNAHVWVEYYMHVAELSERAHGNFWAMEEDNGLLDDPVFHDPNRKAAFPLGGYGWPEVDAEQVLLSKIFGARRPSVPDSEWRRLSIEQITREREDQAAHKLRAQRHIAASRRYAEERLRRERREEDRLSRLHLTRVRRCALQLMGVVP